MLKRIWIIGLMATAAVAQTAGTPAKPKTSTTPVKPASQAVSPAAKPAAKAKTAAPKPIMVAKPKAPAATREAKPAAAKEMAVKPTGRRDPFISPLRLQDERMKSTSVCTTGARCLVIDQVVLKGIVKTQQGMIAMVENAAKKQYNLREKDPVYNGSVVKISGDSLIFRETVTDNLGKQTTREVVKRVTAPVN